MAYNPPPTGHVLVILDNYTTAMTGHQEHAGTGRLLNHEPSRKLVIEDLCRASGVQRVHVCEPRAGSTDFEDLLMDCLASGQTAVIVVRRPCILIIKQLKEYDRIALERKAVANATCEGSCDH
jgi:indolepyruvate ferredoxin oxidoreductase alpha subunit